MKLSWLFGAAVLVVFAEPCACFTPAAGLATTASLRTASSTVETSTLLYSMPSESDDDDDPLQETAQELKRLRERAHHAQIVNDLFRSDGSSNKKDPLMDLALVGQGTVGAWSQPNKSLANQHEKQKPIPCVFLSTPQASDDVICKYLKRRYPTWEAPPDLQVPQSSGSTGNVIPAVPLPIPITREMSKELKLLSFAFRGRKISKTVFLPLARLLTDHRDHGLWDNLPWTEWTVDPLLKVNQQYTKSARGKKLLLGRRDAYNRMMGKDWYGRSLSAGNLAARVKYSIDGDSDDQSTIKKKKKKNTPDQSNKMESNLAFRILQVQIQEASMELAEAERKYAMVKAKLEGDDEFTSDEVLMTHYEEIKASVDAVQQAIEVKKSVEETLEKFQAGEAQETTKLEATTNEFLEGMVQSRYLSKETDKENISKKSWKEAAQKFVEGIRKQDNLMEDLETILDRESTNKWKNPVEDFMDGVIERSTRNAPPYRGAMGYSPRVDTKEEMFNKAVLPYRSPYDLLVEIIEEQFNAEVVGTVLENSSLFPGTLILEGAVVLRRRGRSKSLTIGGEVVELEDTEDNMGNKGVQMGDTFIVECSGEEAIGMALSCNLPISVERKVWEDVITDISLSDEVEPLPEYELESVMNTIPPVKQAINSANRVTVSEGGEALVRGSKKTETNENKDMETKETKDIRSVTDYDALSVTDKARMILASGRFEGTLPRPRGLREFDAKLENFKTQRGDPKTKDAPLMRTTLSPLDEILVPMLEKESVRLEIFRRDAYRRGDNLAIDAIERTIEEFNERAEPDAEVEQAGGFIEAIQKTIGDHLFKEETAKTKNEREATAEEADDSIEAIQKTIDDQLFKGEATKTVKTKNEDETESIFE